MLRCSLSRRSTIKIWRSSLKLTLESWAFRPQVVGQDVPYALLEAISNEGIDKLQLSLANLKEAEFLYETQLFPEFAYRFKHAFTHQVAYEALLKRRRRALHAKLGEALEWLYPERLAEFIEELATHYQKGEMWREAVSGA